MNTTRLETTESSLRTGLRDLYCVVRRGERLEVSLPAYMDDGDQIPVFVELTPDGPEINDGGRICEYFSMHGIDVASPVVMEPMKRILERYQLRFGQSMLRLPVTDTLGWSGNLMKWVGAVSRIMEIEYGLPSDFLTEVATAIRAEVGADRCSERWMHPQLDRKKMYPVDYWVRPAAGMKPLIVSACNTESSVGRANLSLRQLICWKYEFKALTIAKDLSTRDETRLGDISTVVNDPAALAKEIRAWLSTAA